MNIKQFTVLFCIVAFLYLKKKHKHFRLASLFNESKCHLLFVVNCKIIDIHIMMMHGIHQ